MLSSSDDFSVATPDKTNGQRSEFSLVVSLRSNYFGLAKRFLYSPISRILTKACQTLTDHLTTNIHTINIINTINKITSNTN